MARGIDVEDCERHLTKYRGENLYIVISGERLDLSLANFDEFRTTAGLALVERLINELLDRGMELTDIAKACDECSYQSGDLPKILGEWLTK